MSLKHMFLASSAFLLTSASFSFAGPPFPCPTAVDSVRGNALAIVRDTIEWNGSVGKLLSRRFIVLSKATFLNDYQRISAPVTYWGDWRWAVVLDLNKQTDREFSMSCLVPLITDDARFLILLKTGPAFDSVLRIYRQADSKDRMEDGTIKGLLVREIKLDQLWPASRIDPNVVWTDHTPEWFAGGKFDFADDNTQVIHKTRWGNAIRINLP